VNGEGEDKSVFDSSFGEALQLEEAEGFIYSLELNHASLNGLQGGKDGTRERGEVRFEDCSAYSPFLIPPLRPCSFKGASMVWVKT